MKTNANIILGVDAALGPCSVAVLIDGQPAAFLEELRPQKQAALLVPMIQAALKAAGVDFPALTAIACSVGPGSFTGLRIGLAAARGIGFAGGQPVYGVSTLAAAALAAGEQGDILAVLPAGKGEVYAQLFSGGDCPVPLAEPVITTLTNLPAHTIAVTSAHSPLLKEDTRLKPVALDARAIAMAALPGREALRLAPEPLYIRPPDAKLPAA